MARGRITCEGPFSGVSFASLQGYVRQARCKIELYQQVEQLHRKDGRLRCRRPTFVTQTEHLQSHACHSFQVLQKYSAEKNHDCLVASLGIILPTVAFQTPL